MTSNELLEVAIGMGCEAELIKGGFHDGKIKVVGKKYCYPYYFEPNTDDLMECLFKKGCIIHASTGWIKFVLQANRADFKPGHLVSTELSLKENLLSIVLQVVRTEKKNEK